MGLEMELGGGWGALRSLQGRQNPKWPANGPITYTAVSLGTPSVYRLRGFFSIRDTRWILMRPHRMGGALTTGLDWR